MERDEERKNKMKKWYLEKEILFFDSLVLIKNLLLLCKNLKMI